MQVLSIGDRIVEGRYRIHSRFERAVNFVDDGIVVSLVTRAAGAGPINIVVDELRTAGVRALTVGTRLAPGGNGPRPVVWLDDRALDCSGAVVYESGLDLIEGRRGIFARLAILRETLARDAPPRSLAFLLDESRREELRPGFEQAFAEHASNCVYDILYGDPYRGVTRLRGAGFGLTPSGDDFIRGVLIGMALAEAVYGMTLTVTRQYVCEWARTGGVLTDALLFMAEAGRVDEKAKSLIVPLMGGRLRDVWEAAREICSVGETSGADFATGLLLTLEAGRALPVLDGEFEPLYDDVPCVGGDVWTVS
jgi:hypothetical protein